MRGYIGNSKMANRVLVVQWLRKYLHLHVLLLLLHTPQIHGSVCGVCALSFERILLPTVNLAQPYYYLS